MNGESVKVRPALPSDAEGIARVHVETWKSTYRGIVPDEFLDRLTVERDLSGGFGDHLRRPPEGWKVFVATRPAGEPVGFAIGGRNREPRTAYSGELGGIYVLQGSQRQGVGRELVRNVAEFLLAQKHQGMLVWVLDANPYRRFYEKLGGKVVLHRIARVAGSDQPEAAYGWRDLGPLARSSP